MAGTQADSTAEIAVLTAAAESKANMRAFRLAESGQPVAAIREDIPRPVPGRGELLIRVCAAGFIAAELSWYPTLHTKTGAPRTGAVPGHEFSGVVAAAGPEVGCLEAGLEVFGMNDWYSDGAIADYCVAPYFAVIPKPPSLTHIDAASVPISGLTAWQGLFDHGRLQRGERVLIHGGAGAVGLFAVQLAKVHGARVIATASAENRDFVLSLGADQVIDYRTERFEESAREIDLVFDTVGGETLDRSWSVLKTEGRLVTVASNTEESSDPRSKKAFFIMEPNQKELAEITKLLVSGQLHTVVDAVIPLSQAPDAYAGKVVRKGRGKLVIAIGDSN